MGFPHQSLDGEKKKSESINPIKVASDVSESKNLDSDQNNVDCRARPWLKRCRTSGVYASETWPGTCAEKSFSAQIKESRHWPGDSKAVEWPGTGSNRRPSDFQSDARTN